MPPPPSARRSRRALLALLAVLLAGVGALWSAGSVAAHAELIEVTPADGELLQDAPAQVVLRWNEPVSLAGGAARVLDDTAAVVSGEPRVEGTTVVIPIVGELRDGTYTVAWDVISEDSHPISAATIFYVGAPSTAGPVDAGERSAAGWGVRTGAVILSTLGYAGALVAVGGWWFLAVAAPAEQRLRRRLGSLVARAAVLGAVALVAAVPLRIARVGGGLGALRDDALLAESITGPLGLSTLVTGVALLVLAGLTGRDAGGRLLDGLGAAAGVVALAGFALEGHTRSQRPRLLIGALDVVHLEAGAIWMGGIAALVVAFRARTAADLLERSLRRFSTLAVAAVVVVVGAGIGMAVIVLPTVGDLVDTGYGLALLAKTALVVPVIAMGSYNRRRLVPAGPDRDAASDARRSRLARIVGVELVVLLGVVAVTSVLVTRSPIASSAAPPPATAVPADAVQLPLSGGEGTVLFTVAPARAGQNEIYLALVGPGGRPLVPLDLPIVELTEPTIGVGPLHPIVHPLVPGEYHVIADIPFAGTYQMVVRVRISDFAAATAETTVTIR